MAALLSLVNNTAAGSSRQADSLETTAKSIVEQDSLFAILRAVFQPEEKRSPGRKRGEEQQQSAVVRLLSGFTSRVHSTGLAITIEEANPLQLLTPAEQQQNANSAADHDQHHSKMVKLIAEHQTANGVRPALSVIINSLKGPGSWAVNTANNMTDEEKQDQVQTFYLLREEQLRTGVRRTDYVVRVSRALLLQEAVWQWRHTRDGSKRAEELLAQVPAMKLTFTQEFIDQVELFGEQQGEPQQPYPDLKFSRLELNNEDIGREALPRVLADKQYSIVFGARRKDRPSQPDNIVS